MRPINLTGAIGIIIIALCLSSCLLHGERKFKASGIVLPMEVSEDKDRFFIVDKKDFREVICADLTKDGSDEIIVTQLYYKKDVPIIKTSEDFNYNDSASCVYVYIYNQRKELLYSERIWPLGLDAVKVQNGRIYGTIPPLTGCIAFKDGRFYSYNDQYKQLVGDEVINISADGEDVDPATCARGVVMRYYDTKGDYTNDERFPISNIQLMGSEASVTIDYNSNMHTVWLEAPFELPPKGVWVAIKMEITAGTPK